MSAIHEANSFHQIPFEELASPDTCVAFDLDDTVFIEALPIMRNANHKARKEFLDSIRSTQGDKGVTLIYDTLKYRLVEECLLEKLSTKGLQCIGFTARRTGRPTKDSKKNVEDSTSDILKELGVAFRPDIFNDTLFENMHAGNPEYKNHVVNESLYPFEFPSGVMIKNGIVFCNNIDKGLVLQTIFSRFGYHFKTFCLIDDRIENHHSMSKIAQTLEVNYVGYHYKGADLLDNEI